VRRFGALVGLVAGALALAAGLPRPAAETMAGAATVAAGAAARPAVPTAAPPAGPPRNALRDAYFGDLHVHTAYSIDSYIFGNRLGPRDAYRFARGEAVTLYGGATQKLRTPLDFAAVTDHADGLDLFALCVRDEQNPQYSSAFCRGVRAGDMTIFRRIFSLLEQRPPPRFEVCNAEGVSCPGPARGPWQDIQKIAQEFNDPGRFTTLIAYEYSPLLVDGGMLHRNVIFRGTAVTEQALGAWDLVTQADFWKWLDSACTGECQALAIPHNTNYSWGLQFADTNDDGRAYTRDDWARRTRLERLVEVTQHKGNSECAVGLGTTDEECAFEQIFPLCKPGQTTGCARDGSYIRGALKRGLELEDEIGMNPYQLGFIGSTDTHNALAGGAEESDWHGHHASVDDTPEKRLHGGAGAQRPRVLMNPGGLAGVWAESNTRGDIFDALRRKETFATSGTRIKLRFFGSFAFSPELAPNDGSLEQAYAQGVPMGGDLKAGAKRVESGARGESGATPAVAAPGASAGAAPSFLVWAIQDPSGARLDRIQIVKGFTAASGTAEAIYDVVCADGRKPDATTHRCPKTAAGVDLETCAPSSREGAGELSTVWTDPEFDASKRAFYYVRVLENPTCRWSTWEAMRAGEEPPKTEPSTVQERAWSSPIWYSP
jgi:uncharacterized protein DUF3604